MGDQPDRRWRRPVRRSIRGATSTLVALAAAVVVIGAALGPGAGRVDAAAYDRFYADFQGEELMRAINADRAALGLARLAADPSLASVARDRAVICPSNASLTIRGRTRDMADRNYLGHDIPGCSDAQGGTFSTFDLLTALGFTWTVIGENIASNNYPSSKTSYDTGCTVSGTGCHGAIDVPWAVAVTERGWMSSSAHRTAMLSTTFVRFGCGAWNGASDRHVYSCYFVAGGTASIDGTGPAITAMSGVGSTYAAGSTPKFTATASDGHSLLSDGHASIDGSVIRSWAHDHDGATEGLSAIAPPLSTGEHTFTWWERDTSTNSHSVSFTFSVGGGSSPRPSTATPRPTGTRPPATQTPPPTTGPATTAHARPSPVATSREPSTPPTPTATSEASPTEAPTDGAVDGASEAVAADRAVGPSATTGPGGDGSTALAGRQPDPGGWLVPGLAALALVLVGVAAGRWRGRHRYPNV